MREDLSLGQKRLNGGGSWSWEEVAEPANRIDLERGVQGLLIYSTKVYPANWHIRASGCQEPTRNRTKSPSVLLVGGREVRSGWEWGWRWDVDAF